MSWNRLAVSASVSRPPWTKDWCFRMMSGSMLLCHNCGDIVESSWIIIVFEQRFSLNLCFMKYCPTSSDCAVLFEDQ